MSGTVSPLMAKPVPLTLACETLRLALPGLLKVIICVFVTPMGTLPKLTLAGDTEICCCTAVPERPIVTGPLALLTTLALPVTLPELVGAKTTLNVAVCPAASVAVSPLVMYPAGTLIAEMFTMVLPALVSVTVCALLLLPRETFPKLSEAGLAESCKVEATPVPLRATLVGEFGALLAKEMLPVREPVLAGVNATSRFALCPGSKLKGTTSPVNPNPLPETLACDTERFAVPEFVSVMV